MRQCNGNAPPPPADTPPFFSNVPTFPIGRHGESHGFGAPRPFVKTHFAIRPLGTHQGFASAGACKNLTTTVCKLGADFPLGPPLAREELGLPIRKLDASDSFASTLAYQNKLLRLSNIMKRNPDSSFVATRALKVDRLSWRLDLKCAMVHLNYLKLAWSPLI